MTLSAEELQRRVAIHRKYWRDVAAEDGIGAETYRYRLQKLKWGPAKAAMHPIIRNK